MKNKFTFITNIAIILLIIFCIRSNAQHVNYTYDANGNRVSRSYSATLMMNSTTNDPKADEVAAHYGIGVYPNPLMDGSSVTVVVKGAETSESSEKNNADESATVYVLDNSGKMLFSQKQTTSSPSQIDLGGYSAGIYYIKVAIGKEQLFYKITKAK